MVFSNIMQQSVYLGWLLSWRTVLCGKASCDDCIWSYQWGKFAETCFKCHETKIHFKIYSGHNPTPIHGSMLAKFSGTCSFVGVYISMLCVHFLHRSGMPCILAGRVACVWVLLSCILYLELVIFLLVCASLCAFRSLICARYTFPFPPSVYLSLDLSNFHCCEMHAQCGDAIFWSWESQ